jgi:hypothetical protein
MFSSSNLSKKGARFALGRATDQNSIPQVVQQISRHQAAAVLLRLRRWYRRNLRCVVLLFIQLNGLCALDAATLSNSWVGPARNHG